MADYYKKKTVAFEKINEWYSEGLTEEEIIYKIQNVFGFGKKMVSDRIKMLDSFAERAQKQKERRKNIEAVKEVQLSDEELSILTAKPENEKQEDHEESKESA